MIGFQPLVLEVTALPSEPQPLPKKQHSFLIMYLLLCLPKHDSLLRIRNVMHVTYPSKPHLSHTGKYHVPTVPVQQPPILPQMIVFGLIVPSTEVTKICFKYTAFAIQNSLCEPVVTLSKGKSLLRHPTTYLFILLAQMNKRNNTSSTPVWTLLD